MVLWFISRESHRPDNMPVSYGALIKHHILEIKNALVLAILLTVPALFGQAIVQPVVIPIPAVPPAGAKPEAAAAVPAKPPAGGWAFEVATIKPAKMPNPADMMNGKAHVAQNQRTSGHYDHHH